MKRSLLIVLLLLASPAGATSYYVCSGSVFGDFTPGEQRCIPDSIVGGWSGIPQEEVLVKSSCEQRMAEAMRAHDHVHSKKNEESTSYIVTDGTATITWGSSPRTGLHLCEDGSDRVCYTEPEYPTYTPDTRTEEEKLDDKFKALVKEREDLKNRRGEEQEREGRRIMTTALKTWADRLWADVKRDCWGK